MASALHFSMSCKSCRNGFSETEEIINAGGEAFHAYCFVCAQCFQQYEDGIYYEFENRKYCEQDFKLLFAPTCRGCSEYISGRVIKAINSSWHSECFCCDTCGIRLADIGFIKNSNRALCRDCNDREKGKSSNNLSCNKCSLPIRDGILKYKNEVYHPDHFNCKTCNIELNSTARELKGDLYCMDCYCQMEIAICAACRRSIDSQITINALGKQWHIEHFVCTKCEKPFNGSKYYEKRSLAYCEYDYKLLFGDPCFTCNQISVKDVFTAWNKSFCSEHFCCYLCDKQMSQKTKFYEFDLKPICKHCFDKLPSRVKTFILKSTDRESKTNFKL